MENLQLFDESNDHKYFTVIPNFILNHSTAVAQALYLQLKRLAGEGGLAYPGRRYLMGKLGVSYPTLKKEFQYLLDKGWIKFVGERMIQTDGGRQKVKAYKVIDLWQLNNEYYAKPRSEKIEPPYQRSEKIEPQGVKSGSEKIEPKEDPCIKIPNTQEDLLNTSGDYVADAEKQKNKDIAEVINEFKAVNLSYEQLFKRDNQRAAAERLLLKCGLEKLLGIIKFLPITNKKADLFAPIITTPMQLEEKFGGLAAAIQRFKEKNKNKSAVYDESTN